MSRAASYLRRSKVKSKHEQGSDTVSVADQRVRTRAIAKRESYDLLYELVDDGLSAYRDDVIRPSFERLKVLIEERAIDVVVADAPDRITRAGGREWLNFRALCGDNNVQIHTDRDGLDTDDDWAETRAFFAGEHAHRESREKSRKLRNASTQRAQRGESRNAGPLPFGWAEDRINLHPSHAPLLQAAAQKILKGGSVAGVVKEWNHTGIKTSRGGYWSMSGIKATLTRPRNAGQVVLRGEVLPDVQGEWQPLWDLQTHLDLVTLLGSKGGGKAPTSHLLSGILKCACGEVMRAANAGPTAPVYRCTIQTRRLPAGGMKHATIMRDVADDKARGELFTALMLARTEDLPEDPASTSLAALYGRKNDLKEQVSLLVDAVLSKALTAVDVAPKRAQIEAELEQVEQEIQNLTRDHAKAALVTDLRRSLWDTDTVNFADLVEETESLPQRFDALPLEDQRALVKAYLSLTVTASTGRGAKRIKVERLTESVNLLGKTVDTSSRGTTD